jgi:hypothetical protein
MQPADTPAGCAVFGTTFHPPRRCRRMPRNALGCSRRVQPVCNHYLASPLFRRPCLWPVMLKVLAPLCRWAGSSATSRRRRRGRASGDANSALSAAASNGRPVPGGSAGRCQPGRSCDDAEAARLQANETARPRGVHGPTPAECWAARRGLTADERASFLEAVQRAEGELRQVPRNPVGPPPHRLGDTGVARAAIRTVLLTQGWLRLT